MSYIVAESYGPSRTGRPICWPFEELGRAQLRGCGRPGRMLMPQATIGLLCGGMRGRGPGLASLGLVGSAFEGAGDAERARGSPTDSRSASRNSGCAQDDIRKEEDADLWDTMAWRSFLRVAGERAAGADFHSSTWVWATC